MGRDSVIDADDEAIIRIGNTLLTVASELREVCKAIKANVQDASDNMQDNSGRKTCDSICELTDHIVSLLVVADAFGDQCVNKIAPMLKEAQEFQFKHR